MEKVKLALVSYVNTIPFIEGIKASAELNNKVELIVDYPAKCAELIKQKKVDGGLIPVGALPEIKGYNPLTNYCIGADGAVDTVAIFSQEPIEAVNTIYLDYQSRTSVQLIQILAKVYWKKSFLFLPTQEGFEQHIPPHSAILIIGDRVFKFEKEYRYKIDLSKEWKTYTHLPFVFAIWVGNEKVKLIEEELNRSFELAMQNIPKFYNELLTIDYNTFVNYLTLKIDYTFDKKKKEAIQLFTKLSNYR